MLGQHGGDARPGPLLVGEGHVASRPTVVEEVVLAGAAVLEVPAQDVEGRPDRQRRRWAPAGHPKGFGRSRAVVLLMSTQVTWLTRRALSNLLLQLSHGWLAVVHLSRADEWWHLPIRWGTSALNIRSRMWPRPLAFFCLRHGRRSRRPLAARGMQQQHYLKTHGRWTDRFSCFARVVCASDWLMFVRGGEPVWSGGKVCRAKNWQARRAM